MVEDWNDKAKKASPRVVAASKSHEDVSIVCEPSPSTTVCVCGVSLRRQGGGVEGGAAACGRVGTSLTHRTPAAPLVVWCSRRGGGDDTHTHHGKHSAWRGWMDGSMLIDNKMEMKVFDALMLAMKKRRKLNTLWLVSEGIFCLQSRCQYFNTSWQRRTNRRKNEKNSFVQTIS